MSEETRWLHYTCCARYINMTPAGLAYHIRRGRLKVQEIRKDRRSVTWNVDESDFFRFAEERGQLKEAVINFERGIVNMLRAFMEAKTPSIEHARALKEHEETLADLEAGRYPRLWARRLGERS